MILRSYGGEPENEEERTTIFSGRGKSGVAGRLTDERSAPRVMKPLPSSRGSQPAGVANEAILRPMDYAPHKADQDAIKARGMEKANEGLVLIDKNLAGKDWIVGDFSLADPALFYVSWWAAARLKSGLPANVQKHFERMMDRPSVKRALEDEDLRLAP